MKIIAILITTLIISQYVNAQQTCKIYINDEWQDTRYTVEAPSADNVVTDNKTRLMWKQCSEGLSGPDCNTGTATAYTWQHALDLASTEDFAGFTDWRVPNQKELRTLVARNCYNTSINETVFPNTLDTLLWSSSPTANSGGSVFYVSFDFGIEGSFRRQGKLTVRLVRSSRQ